MTYGITLKQGEKELHAEVDADNGMVQQLIYRRLWELVKAVGPFADNPDKEIEFLTQTLEAFGFKNVKVTVSDVSQ